MLYFIVGGLFMITCVSELITQVLVITSLLRLRLWQRSSPFYVLALANLCNDVALTLLHTVFMSPAVILQRHLFLGGVNSPEMMIVGYAYLVAWYNGATLDILIAINRLIVIKHWANSMSSLRLVTIMSCAPIPIAFVVAVWSQYISSCCPFLLNWEAFGYYFHNPGNVEHVSDEVVDLPLNVSATIISFCCYAWITLFVRTQRLQIEPTSSGEVRSINKEYKQYAMIAVTFTVSWTSFRFFGWFFDFKYIWMSAISAYACILKCGANSFLFLKDNKEIRNEVRQRWTRKNNVEVTARTTPTFDRIA